MSTKTILVLTANPKGTSRLRLDAEVRDISTGLERSKNRDQFQLVTKWAVRSRDIRRAMLDYEPNIVHFSGHGTGSEGLVFEDETGQPKSVEGKALAELFDLFSNTVECVVLNGCYSESQAQLIAQYIENVIGMSQAIGDQAAIEFSVGFYDALGAGRTVDFAYQLGCNSILLSGISENLTPILIQKISKNASLDPPTSRGDKQAKVLACPPLKSQSVSALEYTRRREADDDLSSDHFIDYTRLRNFLAARNWKKADEETWMVMLKVVGSKDNKITDKELLNFPSTDLHTIDRLWVKYSNGHFGFSVQKKIYLSVGGKPDGKLYEEAWNKFGARVGWRRAWWNLWKKDEWISYEQVRFVTSAPQGHLPLVVFKERGLTSDVLFLSHPDL